MQQSQAPGPHILNGRGNSLGRGSLTKRREPLYPGLKGLGEPVIILDTYMYDKTHCRTLISSTTCCQNTSKSWTSSGTPRNLRAVDADATGFSASTAASVGLSSATAVLPSVDDVVSDSVKLLCAAPHASASDEDGTTPLAPFSRALALWYLTFAASRRAAASSCRFVSSGSSFSASRAAYAASRSIRAITICLILTLGCNCAVAERKGPRE